MTKKLTWEELKERFREAEKQKNKWLKEILDSVPLNDERKCCKPRSGAGDESGANSKRLNE